jgi:membrane-associated phospholipid phosphatase
LGNSAQLYPEDKIAISFSILIIITQIYYYVSGFLKNFSDVLIPLIALFALVSLIYFQHKSAAKTLKFVRSYIHIPFYGIIFTAFQSFVHKLSPKDYDASLMNIDLALFGLDVTRWFESYISKGLTEILTLSYFSYYVLPTLTFVFFFYSRAQQSFLNTRNYLLAIVIGWYGAFIFYSVLPAAGPDIAFPEHYSQPLTGLSPLTNTSLENLAKYLKESYVRNTFPSMHFGIILITNYFAYKYKRKYFLHCSLPLGIMLAIATVYLRQHYLIDLVASFPIAAISIYFALRQNRQLQN